MFETNGPGYRPRRGCNSKSRVGGGGGSSLVLDEASSHFSPHLPSPLLFLHSARSVLPSSLSLPSLGAPCRMVCLSALAWNKTKRGLGPRRMLALSQLPSTLSGDMLGKELKESVWLQISSAKWSALATSTRFTLFLASSLLLSSPLLTSPHFLRHITWICGTKVKGG